MQGCPACSISDCCEDTPSQHLLESVLGDKISEEKYSERVLMRESAKTNGIHTTIYQLRLDVIVGPMNGRIPTIAVAAGYLVGTVLLGYSATNGCLFEISVVTLANEHRILQFMIAWDELLPSRLPPPQLMNFNSSE
ncbi:hypothetical protein BOTCAL_0079g00170 [Botryotinia calthae]|uniref:Uncharacterized protein n=1 Tax=Botryotinia calthae TaxID=38488 RepID=A0A4Y8D899_9HELO|nr:hypothetical protein BOTCAL_0079g00170 [Botryotinia calthae]